jgi:hypothetical protein
VVARQLDHLGDVQRAQVGCLSICERHEKPAVTTMMNGKL